MSGLTATVIIAAIAVGCILISTVLVTVALRHALQETVSNHITSDIRHYNQIEHLLDRLMSIKWEDFAALSSIRTSEDEGGFLTPEEQVTQVRPSSEVTIEEPERWGELSRAARARGLTETETALLSEDFPDEDRRST